MNLETFAVPESEQNACTCCRGNWAVAKYRVPGIAGLFCSMTCIEAELFGAGHCRWCGTDLKKPYTSLDSRICSPECSENYYARVLDDRTAALGTGVRFVQWLQSNAPKAFAILTGKEKTPIYDANVNRGQKASHEYADCSRAAV